MSGRFFRALGATFLLLAVSMSGVSAGGWATITADPGNGQPTEGEETTIGFTVLQHGQTPAGWESPTLVATESASGERIESRATGQGADGHFVASITIPRAGYWTWHVELRDLLVESTPLPLAVALADGTMPALDAGAMLAAIERSRADLRHELRAEAGTQLESLRVEISSLASQLAVARSDAARLQDQVDALQAGGPVAASLPGAPVVGMLALAALAGAIAGFAVAWLGRPVARPDASANDPAAAGRLAAR
ncbi:MAG TPA: hypothetical protein VF231_01815 [Candidatus Limnocylindrales bacterium]